MPRKSSKYAALTVKTAAALADEVAGILVAYGSSGCEVKKITSVSRLREPHEVHVRAYFAHLNAVRLRRISKILTAAGMLSPGTSLSLEAVEDPGWATTWQSRFEPLEVGDRLLIVPPWNRSPDPARISIVIKPGQAFGTGHHASTYCTLLAIEQCCRSRPVARALDVGTGSGILALAMAKLGVRDVIAIDIDPTALDNARENAALNRLDRVIRFSAAPLASIRGRFDLIAANILSSVVISMAQQLKTRLRGQGRLVLAGILKREAKAVVSAYRDLTLVSTRNDGKWTALVLQR